MPESVTEFSDDDICPKCSRPRKEHPFAGPGFTKSNPPPCPVDVSAVYRNTLMAIATAAVIDDQFCAHDVIELLNAFGLRSVVSQAREQAKRRKA